MPGKLLGRADLAATTNTTLYTVPVGAAVAATVGFCNRNGTAVSVRLAMSDGASPANADYLEFDTLIPANGVLERGGIVLDAGKRIVVYSSGTGVSAQAWGFEE